MELEPKKVVLRDVSAIGDSRYLWLSYSDTGDLLIQGQDLGNTVEALFGCREYEWIWTVKRADLPALSKALGEESNLLGALEKRFGGNAADQLGPFLDDRQIPYERWSRIGD